MDFRNKKVILDHEDTTIVGEPWSDLDKAHIGQTGVARSVFADGRASHDEGYLVEFPDGHVVCAVTRELRLA